MRPWKKGSFEGDVDLDIDLDLDMKGSFEEDKGPYKAWMRLWWPSRKVLPGSF